MRWFRAIIFLTLLALHVLGAAQAARQAPAEAGAVQRVLVVHSYNPGYIWTDTLAKGIQGALPGDGITLETHYLDAKRDLDPESLAAKAQAILRRIEHWRPQVVIASDDAAQIYLTQPFLKGRPWPQVIFCGVNAPLKTYGFPAANVSGVRERWHFRESFALLKKLAPRATRAAMLSDGSESSAYVLADLAQDQRQNGPFALALVASEQVQTFQQWQRKVQDYQTRADALALGLYHSLRDERTGGVVPPETVMAWTNAANRLPSIGFTDYAVGGGLLCGVLESAHEQGYLAGTMARQVLEKKLAAGALPVRTNVRGTVLLNLKTAERLGLRIPFEFIQAAGIIIK
ncbi:MAG TPA: ABC transporter substrate binding protein [Humidesulfovibrio sp.]|uniref:ABC transporter substrate-binding protein n=1 Tax=Humidesulfovibrio sp. TaxID=2910988 RepID=UPI002C5E2D5F|nr:ABC transporter substrate binding protein [Humidesulfovibrio sp.]HWR04100.1 ABC transporter substrate binding protein [Humidesulfovibrio sp.]